MELKINKKKLKQFYIPSSFTVLFAIMLFFIVASWIGSAISNKIYGVGILDIFPAIWHGFKEKSAIILFIFSIGGTLGVMTKTQAIDAGIQSLVTKLKGKEWMLISSLSIVFGLNGTTTGLWEETIAFFPVLIPIFIKANYGGFVAVATILIGTGTGVLSSTINPFAVGTAVEAIINTGNFNDFSQSIGQGQRWVTFIIFQIIGIIILLKMASYSKKRHGVIKLIDNDAIKKKFGDSPKLIFNLRRKIVLILFILAFIIMIIGFLPWNSILNINESSSGWWDRWAWWLASTNGTWEKLGSWTFISAAAIFLIITIVILFISHQDFIDHEENNKEMVFINSYVNGIKEIISVSLLISVAAGLGIILSQTNFGLLIAESIKPLASNNLIIWGIVIFIISLFLSFLIPSTSGFSSAFIGIFATSIAVGTPFEKQNAALALTILAFIMASGIINLCSPTSATLVAYTTYAKIPYLIWLKKTYFVYLIYFGAAILIMIIFGFLANNLIIF